MTKRDLINKLVEVHPHLNSRRAEAIVNSVFESMTEAMVLGDRIEIRGLGSFVVKDYQSYAGRNPRTGEKIVVSAKKLPFFKVGKDLKERILAG